MNDEIAKLQSQLDLLSNEFRKTQSKQQRVEARTAWRRPNIGTLIVLIASAALCVGSWSTKASSGNSMPAVLSPDMPTKVKAPFQVVDEKGIVIMSIQDHEGSTNRGAYLYNRSGKSIVDLTSTADSGGGGKITVTADGAEISDVGEQATGVTISGLRQTTGIQVNRDGKKAVAISSEAGGKDGSPGGSVQIFNGAEKPSATLESEKGGGALKIFDAANKTSASLDAQTDGGSLKIFGSGEKKVATLDAQSSGGSLKIFGSAANPVTTIDVQKDGGNLKILGPGGKQAIALETQNDGGSLSVFGLDEKAVGTLKSDAGDGKFWISDKSGKEVAGVFAKDNGGVMKVLKAGDPTTYTAINAIDAGIGLMVRNGGLKRAYVGTAGSDGGENGVVYVYSKSDTPAAGIRTYDGGKGLVAVFNDHAAIALLSESSKHPGGGEVSVTDPNGSGVFAAGYSGDGGEACVNRKSGLKCLGIGLPLQ